MKNKKSLYLVIFLGLMGLFLEGCPSDEELLGNTVVDKSHGQHKVVINDAGRDNVITNGDDNKIVKANVVEGGIHFTDNTSNTTVNVNRNGKTTSQPIVIEQSVADVDLANGKKVVVTIQKIHQLHKWLLGSIDHIGKDEDPQDYFTAREYVDSVKNKTPNGAIVTVGLASHEFEAGRGRIWEEQRALSRAESLGEACHTTFPDRSVYTLNLGVHDQTSASSAESMIERRVVMVIIDTQEAGNLTRLTTEEINEGVIKGLEAYYQEGKLKFDLEKYSLWNEVKVQEG
jgi:hypothetical protein